MKKIFVSGKTILVSDTDFLYLSGCTWWIFGNYIQGWINGKKQFIHTLIAKRMGLDLESKEIDHIDGNSFNNQRNNLRSATKQQNQANSVISKNNTSGYKGIYQCKSTRRWRARIVVNNKSIHLGYFDTPEEAHQAYCAAAEKYFGEFARAK